MLAVEYKNMIGNKQAVTLGVWNHILGISSTFIVIESNSIGKDSVADGRRAVNKGENSVAIGKLTKTNEYYIVLGQ